MSVCSYQMVGDCGVPGDQIGWPRLEIRTSLRDVVASVPKSESFWMLQIC